MRTILCLLAACFFSAAAHAQTVASFDTLSLPGSDTFYVNYSASGTDVGFADGLAYFPCVYDTSFGGYWSYGFAYSNKTDTVTSGYMNQYSAKPGTGVGGSAQYAVAYGQSNILRLSGNAIGMPVTGFWITNSTYAHNSMRDGDGFAKKFGGTAGNDPDWFKLTVFGYLDGLLKTDSIEFYLADFRDADNTKDSILKDWRWLSLSSIGKVDSLLFSLSSSDTGMFGMNTPAYFCLDNFTTDESNLSVPHFKNGTMAKVFPNPATDQLFVSLSDPSVSSLRLFDLSGKLLSLIPVTKPELSIPLTDLPAGSYILQLNGRQGKNAGVRFIKQ